ncbi:MAG TPA: cation transporter [Armatimonadota bacterium]|nr:cation transporter [Armatimonadota bacterium]
MAQSIRPQVASPERAALLRQGLLLVALSITWMVIEGVVSVTAGLAASSVALLAFGVDSFIELASDGVVAWRLLVEQRGGSPERVEEVERKGSRLAGVILWILAAYITVDAGRSLLGYGEKAEESLVGIGITAAALVIMPLLARNKLRIANALDSRALRTDAYEAMCCAWLSVTALAGLTLNALFGWWWADPAAALVIVPLLIKEGREGWRGGGCCECG